MRRKTCTTHERGIYRLSPLPRERNKRNKRGWYTPTRNPQPSAPGGKQGKQRKQSFAHGSSISQSRFFVDDEEHERKMKAFRDECKQMYKQRQLRSAKAAP
jgi:hypothetical protein